LIRAAPSGQTSNQMKRRSRSILKVPGKACRSALEETASWLRWNVPEAELDSDVHWTGDRTGLLAGTAASASGGTHRDSPALVASYGGEYGYTGRCTRVVQASGSWQVEMSQRPLNRSPGGNVRSAVEAGGGGHSDAATGEGIFPIECRGTCGTRLWGE